MNRHQRLRELCMSIWGQNCDLAPAERLHPHYSDRYVVAMHPDDYLLLRMMPAEPYLWGFDMGAMQDTFMGLKIIETLRMDQGQPRIIKRESLVSL